MTSLGLPSQSAMFLAGGVATGATASDRSPAGQPDAQDSSAFDALLGALDDAGAQTRPAGESGAAGSPAPLPAQPTDEASPAVASWRSISAVHSLGSGVLVTLDKRINPVETGDHRPAAPEESKTTADAGASALTNIGWASLIGNLTGATAAVTPASTTPRSAPSSTELAAAPFLTAALARDAGNGTAGAHGAAGATIQESMPSDASPAMATQTVALKAGPPPVAVKVERSITYLGLDPVARNAQAATSAPARPGAKGSPDAGAVQEGVARPPAASLPTQGGASAMSSGDHPKQNSQGAGADGQAGGRGASADQQSTAAQGRAATAATVAGVAETGAGAMSGAGNSLTFVPIDQLADAVASAAEGLNAPIDDAASASAAAARTSPVKELDVLLNPASLGGLSIQMRLSNGNLNVTIKAEKPDTLKLIENESSAISDKLKSLNFSVASLTIKPSDAAASGGPGADASNTGTSGYGEAQQGQSGQTADGSHNGRSTQGGGQRHPAPQGLQIMGEPGGDGDFGHRVI
jgi:chemotaxis protein MotD